MVKNVPNGDEPWTAKLFTSHSVGYDAQLQIMSTRGIQLTSWQ
jgi:hypothetical protein